MEKPKHFKNPRDLFNACGDDAVFFAKLQDVPHNLGIDRPAISYLMTSAGLDVTASESPRAPRAFILVFNQ